MELKLIRHHNSRWGVDGSLFIAGLKVADTVEHPTKYLPPGTYPITLDHLILKRGNGPMKNRTGEICIGRYACAGCVIHSHDTFIPIYFRIQKALKRGTPVFLKVEG